jgi:hypothetical protein
MNMAIVEHEHKKILIDNAICKRRFHLIYEDNTTKPEHVVVKCPHCSVILFEAENHAPVLLAREENLVKSPTGDHITIYNCDFKCS